VIYFITIDDNVVKSDIIGIKVTFNRSCYCTFLFIKQTAYIFIYFQTLHPGGY